MLTAERVRQALDYDPDTGEFHRRIARRGYHAGGRAGYFNAKGYRLVCVDGHTCMAHRLAWFYVYGVMPICQIDHINGVKDDNRIANLRQATNSQNQQNRHGPKQNNACGFLGVFYRKERNRWVARINVNGRTRRLGHFATAEEASAAYLAAKRELHPFSTGI